MDVFFFLFCTALLVGEKKNEKAFLLTGLTWEEFHSQHKLYTHNHVRIDSYALAVVDTLKHCQTDPYTFIGDTLLMQPYLPLQGMTRSGLILRKKYSPPGCRPLKFWMGVALLHSSFRRGSSGCGLIMPINLGRTWMKTWEFKVQKSRWVLKYVLLILYIHQDSVESFHLLSRSQT